MKSNLYRKIALVIMLLLPAIITAAQTKKVTGKVIDLISGLAVPSVTVTEKGTGNATSSDASGNYSINVSGEASVLSFTSIGYTTQEITVGKSASVDARMQQSTQNLSDVVVVGYGSAKKATVTGSISTIKGSEVVKSPAANVSNNLVGRLPGLSAIQPSGEPGYDGSTLRVRGVNTLRDNNMLVVVDGVPGRSLDRIDPNSIESITVLKDASAAIYGSRAANGVMLITTKRGHMGKPEINLNLNYGYNQPTRTPKMADAPTYATMLNEIEYYKHYSDPANYTPVYSDDDIQKYKDGSDPWGHPNTDWFSETLKPWSAQNAANITLSGGAENVKYFVSLGGRHQDGNYYHSATHYNQYDFRTNLDARISNSISLSLDIAGRQEDRNYPTRSAGDIFRMVMRGKPNLPAYWPNGTPGPDIEYGNNPVVVSTDATGADNDKWYALNSNVKLNINVPWVSGLTLTGSAAFDKSLEFRKLWQTPWYLYTWDYTSYDEQGDPVLVKGKRGFDAPQLTEYSQDQITTTLDFLANYEHKFGSDHALKILAGIEQIKGNGESFNAFRKNFPSGALPELFAGGTIDLNNTGTGYVNARLSYFGRVNYNYKEKYLAEFVWRYDGSYIFAENQRFGFFPGISLGWRLSKENFWKVDAINDFKLRASWGKTGNDRINEWQYISTYAYGNPLGLPYYPFVTGTTENQTLYEVRVPNPDVTWEVANQFDVGFDMSLFKSKLNIVADYFYYKRSNILFRKNASIPLTAGIVLPDQNIGKVANQGFDFAINYHDNIGNVNYQVGINGGYAKNKVLFWDESPGRPAYQQITGHPMPTDIVNNADAALYYKAIGVFQSQDQIDKTAHWPGAIPGDIIFADVNNDGVIDANDRQRSYKTNIPTFTGGITLDIQYAGFDLSALFQGATGAAAYISTESGEIGNYLESFADGRSTPDKITNKPRVFNRTNEYWVNNANTYWLLNTDYFRLKNLQIGYSLPSNTIRNIGIQNLRIYLSGYNLFTISPNYKDFDPEAAGSATSQSVSGQSYPLQRVVSIGLSVTF